MYYPYFRGKQFELIAIRESADLIASAGFVPIIEPVRQSLGGLTRTLDTLSSAGGQAIVVINPLHGDLRGNGSEIQALLERSYGDSEAIRPGLLVRSDSTLADVNALLGVNEDASLALIHAGFTDGRSLRELIADRQLATNVFVEEQTSTLYRRHFAGTRILIRDGFERKKNADYDAIDLFSDLHVTYDELGMSGYGDFLTVGDSYTEGGGPAYAVAIHLTFIDHNQDDAMFVYHFVSDTNDTPTDPAGKFAQALDKLVGRFESGDSQLIETTAISEFRDLHERGHFPGLGYVKKLSIKHHLETLAAFHSDAANA